MIIRVTELKIFYTNVFLINFSDKWPKELAFLLLTSPKFQNKDKPIFFAKLFKNPVHSWKSRIAVYKAFLTGSPRYLEKQKKFCGVTPIIRDLLETGFETFHTSLDVDRQSKLCCESGHFKNDENSEDLLPEGSTETPHGTHLGTVSGFCEKSLRQIMIYNSLLNP